MYWVLRDLIVPSDSSAAAPELEQQRRTAKDIRLPFARGIVHDTLWRFMRDKDVGPPWDCEAVSFFTVILRPQPPKDRSQSIQGLMYTVSSAPFPHTNP